MVGILLNSTFRANPSSVGDSRKSRDDSRFSVGLKFRSNSLAGARARTEVAEQKLTETRATTADKERLLTGEVRPRFAETLGRCANAEFLEQLIQQIGSFSNSWKRGP